MASDNVISLEVDVSDRVGASAVEGLHAFPDIRGFVDWPSDELPASGMCRVLCLEPFIWFKDRINDAVDDSQYIVSFGSFAPVELPVLASHLIDVLPCYLADLDTQEPFICNGGQIHFHIF